MDTIKVTGIEIYAYHGVEQFEKEKGQRFLVDITVFGDTSRAGISDDLNSTINYAELSHYVNQEFSRNPFDLIEAAAENLARKILMDFSIVNDIEITVHKPEAPIGLPFADASVTIRRKRHNVFVAVGSNMGDSREILERASEAIVSQGDISIIRKSSLIVTKPYGVTDQPDFLNGMWEVSTILGPEELLDRLHEIEAGEKRERIIHWGPRTLDLDIIYYDNLVMDSDNLTIPHLDMHNREFVLKPLAEIAPYKRHPITGLTAVEMLAKLK